MDVSNPTDTRRIWVWTACSQVGGAATALLTARSLSIGEMSVFTSALIAVGILIPLLSFGFPDVLFREELSRNQDGKAVSRGLAIYGWAAGLATSVMLLASALGFRWHQLDARSTSALVVLVGLDALAGLSVSLLLVHDQAINRSGHTQRVQSFSSILTATLLLAMPLGLLPSTWLVALIARVIPNAGTALWQVASRPDLRFSMGSGAAARQTFKLGGKFYVTGLLALGSMRADQLLAVSALAPSSLANFGVLLPALTGLRSLGASTTVLSLRRALASSDSGGARAEASLRAGLVVLCVALPAFTVIGGLYSIAIRLVLGPTYNEAMQAGWLFFAGLSLALASEYIIRTLRSIPLVWPGVLGRVVALAALALTWRTFADRGASDLQQVGLCVIVVSAALFVTVACATILVRIRANLRSN
jgi:hypothetical protein